MQGAHCPVDNMTGCAETESPRRSDPDWKPSLEKSPLQSPGGGKRTRDGEEKALKAADVAKKCKAVEAIMKAAIRAKQLEAAASRKADFTLSPRCHQEAKLRVDQTCKAYWEFVKYAAKEKVHSFVLLPENGGAFLQGT